MPLQSFYIQLQNTIQETKTRITHLFESPRSVGLAFLGCGLAISAVSAWTVGSNALSLAKEENTTNLEKTREAIKTKLRVEVAHLAALEGLYDASNEVEEDEFASFLDAIFEGSNGTKGRDGIGFVKNELKDHQLLEAASGKTLDPSAESRIRYIHPVNWRNKYLSNLNTLELGDMIKTMSISAINNIFSVTNSIKLGSQSNGKKPLFSKLQKETRFMVHPVYKKEYVSTLSHNPGSEDTSVEGWVFSNFDTANFLRQAISTVDLRHTNGVCVKDNSKIILGPCENLNSSRWGLPSLVSSQSMDFGGQDLDLYIKNTDTTIFGTGVFRTNLTNLSFYTLFTGAFISLIGAYAVSYFSHSHIRTKQALSDSQRLLDEQSLAATVFEASSTAILVCDSNRKIMRANASFTRLTGFNPIELKGKDPNILNSGRHTSSFFEDMYLRLQSAGYWSGKIWNKTKDNELVLHDVSINIVFSESNDMEPLYYVANYQDITEQDRVGREAMHRATHDQLTGFLNKKAFMENLNRHVALSKRHDGQLAIFFLDLNMFKPINDTYGHEAGDLVLKVVSRRLASLFRESDLLARNGGDEFVIAALGITSSSDVEVLVDRIKHVVSEPIDAITEIDEATLPASNSLILRVETSVGVALFPEHGDTPESLVEFADQQMYVDKRQSKNSRNSLA